MALDTNGVERPDAGWVFMIDGGCDKNTFEPFVILRKADVVDGQPRAEPVSYLLGVQQAAEMGVNLLNAATAARMSGAIMQFQDEMRQGGRDVEADAIETFMLWLSDQDESAG